MWPLTTFTIGFRGIMVIHRVQTENPNFYEVGVVDDPAHSLRINTIKNGMLAETAFLNKPGPSESRLWTLEADNPIATGVSTYTRGSSGNINRKNHQHERDFRWLAELKEILPDMEPLLITDQFAPVLRIYDGIFYTRVKSPNLSKIENGASREFGSIAAVVACDIPMLAAGSVRLVEQPTGTTLFTFAPDENTIYEFANTPGDAPHSETEVRDDSDEEDPDPCRFDHFKSYYRLFPRTANPPSICFIKAGGPPAPDPATCGAIGSGGLTGPFGGG
jgi:hypothetical protein